MNRIVSETLQIVRKICTIGYNLEDTHFEQWAFNKMTISNYCK